jgi:hypothetical protein
MVTNDSEESSAQKQYGGNKFLRNLDKLPEYTASHPIPENSNLKKK